MTTIDLGWLNASDIGGTRDAILLASGLRTHLANVLCSSPSAFSLERNFQAELARSRPLGVPSNGHFINLGASEDLKRVGRDLKPGLTVVICVPTRDRGRSLAQALSSLRSRDQCRNEH
jgi:hypothetical protein